MSNATTSKRTCPRSGSSTRAPPLLLMPSSKRSAAATESRFVDLVDPSHAKGRNFHSLESRDPRRRLAFLDLKATGHGPASRWRTVGPGFRRGDGSERSDLNPPPLRQGRE